MFTKTIVKEVKVIDETKVKELEQELRQLKVDFASEKRIQQNEAHIQVQKAIEDIAKENTQLKEKNAVLEKEVEILQTAFENMGFDVKDMKEILNKLVDGIVSKNTINVVK